MDSEEYMLDHADSGDVVADFAKHMDPTMPVSAMALLLVAVVMRHLLRYYGRLEARPRVKVEHELAGQLRALEQRVSALEKAKES